MSSRESVKGRGGFDRTVNQSRPYLAEPNEFRLDPDRPTEVNAGTDQALAAST